MLRKDVELYRSLKPLLRMYPWGLPAVIAIGVFASLAEGIGISLFIPFLQSINETQLSAEGGNWLLDALSGLFAGIPPEQRLTYIAGGILLSVLVRTSLTYSNNLLLVWMKARIIERIRSKIFERIMRMNHRNLDGQASANTLNVLTAETWRSSEAITAFIHLVVAICMFGVFSLLLLLISWQLTLVVLTSMAAISGIARWLTRKVRSLGKRVTLANEMLQTRMLDGVEGNAVIRAFGHETYEQGRFDRAADRVSRARIHVGKLSELVPPVYQILAATLLVSILFVTLQTPGNLPTILVFIFLLYRLQPKMQQIEHARVNLSALQESVERVTAFLEQDTTDDLHSGPHSFERTEREIRLDGVSFRYEEGGEAALQDVDVVIPEGKTTALVGPSGAGKSTLVKLLLRFYDPDEGVIRVDGQPLPDLDLDDWRSTLALVSQDVYVFNTTVRQNIRYGRLDATDEEIKEAARKADAHRFIQALPSGYDTQVGDRGARLSGGQKQRLTLARAIVRDPQLLILDEATNSLDSISENLIQDALDLLSRDRTVVIVAHRLSTIQRADHIVVLEEGRVVEQGCFEELLANEQLFARLYRLQHEHNGAALPHENTPAT